MHFATCGKIKPQKVTLLYVQKLENSWIELYFNMVLINDILCDFLTFIDFNYLNNFSIQMIAGKIAVLHRNASLRDPNSISLATMRASSTILLNLRPIASSCGWIHLTGWQHRYFQKSTLEIELYTIWAYYLALYWLTTDAKLIQTLNVSKYHSQYPSFFLFKTSDSFHINYSTKCCFWAMA